MISIKIEKHKSKQFLNNEIIKNLKIINNVYQEKYENSNINSTGLGDFLRGCYFLLDFCKKNNFDFNIIFNSCISKFLKYSTDSDLPEKNIENTENILKNIKKFENKNIIEDNIQQDKILYPRLDKNINNDFIYYLNNTKIYNENIFIYCISFPNNCISQENKDFIKKILEPVDDIKENIKFVLNNLNLTFKEYSVIHIRSGDDYLVKKSKVFNNAYINKLIYEIQKCISENINNKYLIIADNNEIKLLLKNYFPFLKFFIKEITHFGEGTKLEEEKVKNTLIDFYLLSHSKSIFSFSTSSHGSGFSYWCAKTYDIPYICTYIK